VSADDVFEGVVRSRVLVHDRAAGDVHRGGGHGAGLIGGHVAYIVERRRPVEQGRPL
jgi:hypothetical protein